MNTNIIGIHHITAMAGDAQRNVDFYVSVLGLRLVKRSINQDVPDVYHLYYGDAVGSPGTAMTFFPFGRAARGRRGSGEIGRVSFAAPPDSKEFWSAHLSRSGVVFTAHAERFGESFLAFEDPDGLRIELVFTDRHQLAAPWKQSTVPVEYAIKGFHGVEIMLNDGGPTAEVLTDVLGARTVDAAGDRVRYVIGTGQDEVYIDLSIDPALPPARQSAGSVHHLAWRVTDDESHRYWQQRVSGHGLGPTEVIDRFYFHSIYFREPGGVLYEIATDNPGFTVDEPESTLGSSLVLPPWYEPQRSLIEHALPPLTVPERRVVS